MDDLPFTTEIRSQYFSTVLSSAAFVPYPTLNDVYKAKLNVLSNQSNQQHDCSQQSHTSQPQNTRLYNLHQYICDTIVQLPHPPEFIDLDITKWGQCLEDIVRIDYEPVPTLSTSNPSNPSSSKSLDSKQGQLLMKLFDNLNNTKYDSTDALRWYLILTIELYIFSTITLPHIDLDRFCSSTNYSKSSINSDTGRTPNTPFQQSFHFFLAYLHTLDPTLDPNTVMTIIFDSFMIVLYAILYNTTVWALHQSFFSKKVYIEQWDLKKRSVLNHKKLQIFLGLLPIRHDTRHEINDDQVEENSSLLSLPMGFIPGGSKLLSKFPPKGSDSKNSNNIDDKNNISNNNNINENNDNLIFISPLNPSSSTTSSTNTPLLPNQQSSNTSALSLVTKRVHQQTKNAWDDDDDDEDDDDSNQSIKKQKITTNLLDNATSTHTNKPLLGGLPSNQPLRPPGALQQPLINRGNPFGMSKKPLISLSNRPTTLHPPSLQTQDQPISTVPMNNNPPPPLDDNHQPLDTNQQQQLDDNNQQQPLAPPPLLPPLPQIISSNSLSNQHPSNDQSTRVPLMAELPAMFFDLFSPSEKANALLSLFNTALYETMFKYINVDIPANAVSSHLDKIRTLNGKDETICKQPMQCPSIVNTPQSAPLSTKMVNDNNKKTWLSHNRESTAIENVFNTITTSRILFPEIATFAIADILSRSTNSLQISHPRDFVNEGNQMDGDNRNEQTDIFFGNDNNLNYHNNDDNDNNMNNKNSKENNTPKELSPINQTLLGQIIYLFTMALDQRHYPTLLFFLAQWEYKIVFASHFPLSANCKRLNFCTMVMDREKANHTLPAFPAPSVPSLGLLPLSQHHISSLISTLVLTKKFPRGSHGDGFSQDNQPSQYGIFETQPNPQHGLFETPHNPLNPINSPLSLLKQWFDIGQYVLPAYYALDKQVYQLNNPTKLLYPFFIHPSSTTPNGDEQNADFVVKNTTQIDLVSLKTIAGHHLFSPEKLLHYLNPQFATSNQTKPLLSEDRVSFSSTYLSNGSKPDVQQPTNYPLLLSPDVLLMSVPKAALPSLFQLIEPDDALEILVKSQIEQLSTQIINHLYSDTTPVQIEARNKLQLARDKALWGDTLPTLIHWVLSHTPQIFKSYQAITLFDFLFPNLLSTDPKTLLRVGIKDAIIFCRSKRDDLKTRDKLKSHLTFHQLYHHINTPVLLQYPDQITSLITPLYQRQLSDKYQIGETDNDPIKQSLSNNNDPQSNFDTALSPFKFRSDDLLHNSSLGKKRNGGKNYPTLSQYNLHPYDHSVIQPLEDLLLFNLGPEKNKNNSPSSIPKNNSMDDDDDGDFDDQDDDFNQIFAIQDEIVKAYPITNSSPAPIQSSQNCTTTDTNTRSLKNTTVINNNASFSSNQVTITELAIAHDDLSLRQAVGITHELNPNQVTQSKNDDDDDWDIMVMGSCSPKNNQTNDNSKQKHPQLCQKPTNMQNQESKKTNNGNNTKSSLSLPSLAEVLSTLIQDVDEPMPELEPMDYN